MYTPLPVERFFIYFLYVKRSIRVYNEFNVQIYVPVVIIHVDLVQNVHLQSSMLRRLTSWWVRCYLYNLS